MALDYLIIIGDMLSNWNDNDIVSHLLINTLVINASATKTLYSLRSRGRDLGSQKSSYILMLALSPTDHHIFGIRRSLHVINFFKYVKLP